MGERPPRPHHRTACVKRMVIGGGVTMLGQCWNEGQKNKVRVGIGSAWVGISGKFYSFGIPLLPQKRGSPFCLRLLSQRRGIALLSSVYTYCDVAGFGQLDRYWLDEFGEFDFHCTVSLFAFSPRMRMGCGRALRAFACFVIML